jgi:predicted DNA-binding transcriptional regulator YafY
MSQTARLYWIDSQIRASRFPNAKRVSERFEVSRRTAYADRDVLFDTLKAPIKFDRIGGGWIYTDRTFVLPFLALSESEGRALARSLLTAREYLGPMDAAAIDHLAEKLGEYVPPARSGSSESVSGSVRSAPDTFVSQELRDDCEMAIQSRRRLHLMYYSAHRNETNERIVQPYHLHNHQGEWHLIAWCEMRKSIRQFFLGRIRNWRLLVGEGAYSIASNFDGQDYLSKGFGALHGDQLITARLVFSAHQAIWIRERVYHASQQTKELTGGRLEITLQVAGTQEIQRWILGYGPEVEVLEPDTLRHEIAEAAKKIVEIYREK